MPIDLRLDPDEVPLLNDLYEFTVSAAFFERGMNAPASFDVGVRRLPPNRGFMVMAGVERVLEVLENFHFEESAIAYLESLGIFKADFLDFLRKLRFTGTVRAMREGSLFFAGEVVMEVRAPLIEAQIIEPIVLNQLGIASVLATKAARCFAVGQGRRLVEFGLRRAQGADAGLLAARSSYLAGFHGSSNVLAGKRYGIPVFGTMSHSFIMAHQGERRAFEDFARSFPKLSTMLVDTYDTLRGVHNAVDVARRLKADGINIQAIRLDSGNLEQLSKQSRRILDDAGLRDVAIFASGNLDEYKIAELLAAGSPIDAFGIGTALSTSDDAPAADYTYKLSDYAGRPRLKTSAGKISLPGRKQVFRALDGQGRYRGDILGLIDESPASIRREFRPEAENVTAMLEVLFEDGKRVVPQPTLEESRQRFLRSFEALDPRFKAIRSPDSYPVKHSAALGAMIIGEKLRAETLQD
jgi:nicotinate phosphoribosyltransferase